MSTGVGVLRRRVPFLLAIRGACNGTPVVKGYHDSIYYKQPHGHLVSIKVCLFMNVIVIAVVGLVF